MGVAGAMRRKGRPLNEAEPQNVGVVIRPGRDAHERRRGRGSGKKNENRRFRHGWFAIRMGDAPVLHLGDNC